MMREWIAIALGGLVGTVLRHAAVSLIALAGPAMIPLATLLVNIVGCFAIGGVFQWSVAHQMENHWGTMAVRAGVLGGLTTFSSFGLDIVRLWQAERPEAAVGLAAAHILLGIGAVVLGMQMFKG